MTDVDTRVTPSLHVMNVHEMEDYDDETAPFLGQVETAFSTAYEGLRNIHDAREAAKRNPTWNEAQAVIQTSDYASKVMLGITKTFDSAEANLAKAVTALEAQLSAPVTSKAAHAVSAEIRSYVKNLKASERMTFLQKAIESGDETTASAVLGGPSYLSGLDGDMQGVLTRMYHERISPKEAKRVRAMKAAQELMSRNAGLLFGQVEKAVGMPPARVHALRQAKTESEQAFILKDS